MPEVDLKGLARKGAIARLAELRVEEEAILTMFPDLRRGVDPGDAAGGTTLVTTIPRRRRRRMSAAQKAEVSRWMKAYWAKRRKLRTVPERRPAREAGGR